MYCDTRLISNATLFFIGSLFYWEEKIFVVIRLFLVPLWMVCSCYRRHSHYEIIIIFFLLSIWSVYLPVYLQHEEFICVYKIRMRFSHRKIQILDSVWEKVKLKKNKIFLLRNRDGVASILFRRVFLSKFTFLHLTFKLEYW